jgi:hypothetical protein
MVEEWQFLTAGEREQLTRLLARLPLFLMDGAEGRHSFLNNIGLAQLSIELPLNSNARLFAGALVRQAEGEATLLATRPGGRGGSACCCFEPGEDN